VRHLYANFRKRFPGKNLKGLMWNAASATHRGMGARNEEY